ncbi:MAG TPA: flagellar basal body-associated FliL family protein [Granulicella sp.]|jgi:flagellar basal body-associated protein FliL|nr:flagellar basal body-associated FliL family protein [Granulicella sp.]
MATTAPSPTPTKKKGPNLFLIAAVVLLTAAAGAGGWFYWTKTHAPVAGPAPVKSSPGEHSATAEAVTLEPFLANLSAGEGYVKVTITLSVHKAGSLVEEKAAKAAPTGAALLQSAMVRDIILGDLSTQTAAVLLTPEGKTALKKTLKSDLVAKVPGLSIENIFFTDFLVQQ